MNPKSNPALQGAESEHGRWVRQEDALHTLRERVRALEAEVERVQTLHLAEIECCHRSQNEAAQLRRELEACAAGQQRDDQRVDADALGGGPGGQKGVQ